MSALQLSVMFHSDAATETLTGLLEEFTNQTRTKVDLKTIDWNTAWNELLQIALFREGPDVSELGNTWVADFARMVALQPFTSSEIRTLGGEENYLKSSWESGTFYGESEVWAIPWLADTRILFYRRDLLQDAGLDEGTAFNTHEQLVHTLEKLKENGVDIPWVVPTKQNNMTLHHLASWIWGAGGTFFSPDGKQSLFSEPKALQGMREYFSLGRFLSPDVRLIDELTSDRTFWEGKAAVTLSGPWLLFEGNIPNHIRKKIGFGSPPGIPFVGGSHLAIWKHTSHPREAMDLIKFLSSEKAQTSYTQAIGILPASLKVLSSPEFSSDPDHQRMIKRLQTGRSFRPVPMWGMVENRWTTALANIWSEIFANPDKDLEELIKEQILPLNQKLNLTISQG
jgi:multiple sugar transport system substrate-binding protein